MKQKKILSLFLVLGLAFSMTTGCGNSASTSGTEATESASEMAAATETSGAVETKDSADDNQEAEKLMRMERNCFRIHITMPAWKKFAVCMNLRVIMLTG